MGRSPEGGRPRWSCGSRCDQERGGGPDRRQPVGPERRLGDVGRGTGARDVELVLLVGREQERPAGRSADEVSRRGGLDPVDAGQVDIHQDQVGVRAPPRRSATPRRSSPCRPRRSRRSPRPRPPWPGGMAPGRRRSGRGRLPRDTSCHQCPGSRRGIVRVLAARSRCGCPHRPVASRNTRTAITRRLTSDSCVRSSFWKTELMCFSTARSLMNRAVAVAALLRPAASSWSTSSSRSVRPSRGELSWLGLASHQALDDLRVQGRAAARDGVQRRDQLVDLADPFLQQVAEPGDAVGKQVERVVLLDVLREDEHAGLGELGADPLGRVDPLGGEGRGHPDVGEDRVGAVLLHGCVQLDRVGRGRDQLDLGVSVSSPATPSRTRKLSSAKTTRTVICSL